MTRLSPELMVEAYAQGMFPMAEPEEDNQLYWWKPQVRALLPIKDFHISRRLARTIRSGRFEVRRNGSFEEVIRACANHEVTWLSEEIIQVFLELHHARLAYSVAVYDDNKLAGGVYGMAMGKAFFAESMFHTVRDASKVALVGLVDWLAEAGFELLDVQFMTDHLRQFGAFEVDAAEYERRLERALEGFWPAPPDRFE